MAKCNIQVGLVVIANPVRPLCLMERYIGDKFKLPTVNLSKDLPLLVEESRRLLKTVTNLEDNPYSIDWIHLRQLGILDQSNPRCITVTYGGLIPSEVPVQVGYEWPSIVEALGSVITSHRELLEHSMRKICYSAG